MSTRGGVVSVTGGQYGSEGKGVIVAHLANRFPVHVRVGAPNAGHSFRHLGRVWKMQSVPVGWKNPNAILVIGRGALVNPRILRRELEEIRVVDPTIESRLIIDGGAGVLDDRFHEEEGGTQGEIHRRIGSTGEGVGAARHARMARDPDGFCFFRDVAADLGLGTSVVEDTPSLLDNFQRQGRDILLEGSQGLGLSLVHGPWPYVTSNDTGTASLASDTGISVRRITGTVLVVRTHPIRVAGNSGPLLGELTWDEISSRLGKPIVERTTVTKKVRRIGSWDDNLVRDAVVREAPTSIALTFADYLNPEDEGKTDLAALSDRTMRFVEYLERRFEVPVSMIGTGGENWEVIETGKPL